MNMDSDMDIAPPPAPYELSRVLDIERRRIVNVAKAVPNTDFDTCDVLVLGGGVGGVAAAEAAATDGASVIIVEPTSVLGGQLTSQLVPVPDENRYVGVANGASTDRYRALREDVRAIYAAKTPRFRDYRVSGVRRSKTDWRHMLKMAA
jgi:NADPH-dependent 2,4-dienoyl-CoA reductase/sulfur reductase-like enzyme